MNCGPIGPLAFISSAPWFSVSTNGEPGNERGSHSDLKIKFRSYIIDSVQPNLPVDRTLWSGFRIWKKKSQLISRSTNRNWWLNTCWHDVRLNSTEPLPVQRQHSAHSQRVWPHQRRLGISAVTKYRPCDPITSWRSASEDVAASSIKPSAHLYRHKCCCNNDSPFIWLGTNLRQKFHSLGFSVNARRLRPSWRSVDFGRRWCRIRGFETVGLFSFDEETAIQTERIDAFVDKDDAFFIRELARLKYHKKLCKKEENRWIRLARMWRLLSELLVL